MNAHFLKTPSKGVGACKKMKSKDYEKYERENDEAKLRVKNAHPKMILLPRPTKVMKKRRANEVVEKSPHYSQGQTKMCDIAGDAFDSLDDIGILGVAKPSVDKPKLEAIVFTDDVDDAHGDEDIIEVEA
ncbi:hypothetical protein RHGRI_003412 [Rhododendron griersonianum]|uniref:Uncharacterized protein n=1 Tax=Rhododendron griersonianum TaxID=479676 RepID=A0AAV6L4V9_9ERIC|nr:hypothetical protein RHGRI_003412 [Rhododendron griersonianum]